MENILILNTTEKYDSEGKQPRSRPAAVRFTHVAVEMCLKIEREAEKSSF